MLTTLSIISLDQGKNFPTTADMKSPEKAAAAAGWLRRRAQAIAAIVAVLFSYTPQG